MDCVWDWVRHVADWGRHVADWGSVPQWVGCLDEHRVQQKVSSFFLQASLVGLEHDPKNSFSGPYRAGLYEKRPLWHEGSFFCLSPRTAHFRAFRMPLILGVVRCYAFGTFGPIVFPLIRLLEPWPRKKANTKSNPICERLLIEST